MRSVGLSFMATLASLALGGASARAADFDAWSICGADHPSVQAMVRPGEAFVVKTDDVASPISHPSRRG
jgi:hypothetical protein